MISSFNKFLNESISEEIEISEEITQSKNISFAKNGASCGACIEDNTIYLHSFLSTNKGSMTPLLREVLEYLSKNYPNHGIYADCNPNGLRVALKCGAVEDRSIVRVKQ